MNDMNMPIQWQEGSSESVEIGYLNPNGQQCCGHCGVPGYNLCVMNKKQFAKVRLDILRCGLLSGKTPGVGLYLA